MEKDDKHRTCVALDRLAAEMFLMERGGWQSHGVMTAGHSPPPASTFTFALTYFCAF